MFAGCSDECLANFVHVAPISHAHRKTKPHALIAIMPVSHRGVDELRVRHDHGNIIACQDNGAARANLLNSTDDTCYFDPISDGDRSFRQNDQPADEITGNVLQPETDTYSDCSSENRQRSEVDAGI